MKIDREKIIEKYSHIFQLIPDAKKWYRPEIQKDIDNILAKRPGESGREFFENAKYFYGSAKKYQMQFVVHYLMFQPLRINTKKK